MGEESVILSKSGKLEKVLEISKNHETARISSHQKLNENISTKQ